MVVDLSNSQLLKEYENQQKLMKVKKILAIYTIKRISIRPVENAEVETQVNVELPIQNIQ